MIRTIQEKIRAHPFIRTMPEKYLALMAAAAAERAFQPGEILVREGDPANRFFLIQNGRVALQAHRPAVGDVPIQFLSEGDVLGWSWLFAPFVWRFQARAIEPTNALVLDGGHLLVASETDHAFGYELMTRISQTIIRALQATRKRLLETGSRPALRFPAKNLFEFQPNIQSLEERIARHPFLHGLSVQHLNRLGECARPTEFETGQLIFQTGDPADRFYLLEQGSVSLEARRENGPIQIQIIGPGDVLGWSWLFDPYLWNFDARALERTSALFFYGTWLREWCAQNPDFGYELMKRVAQIVLQRLQATRQLLIEATPA